MGGHARQLEGWRNRDTDQEQGCSLSGKPNRSKFSRFREILILQSGRPPTPLPAIKGSRWDKRVRGGTRYELAKPFDEIQLVQVQPG
jgi:hypothetical protein